MIILGPYSLQDRLAQLTMIWSPSIISSCSSQTTKSPQTVSHCTSITAIEKVSDYLHCFSDPCLIHYCAKGRECMVNAKGLPECVCQRDCPYRKKPICGTDGMVYENHCELHRAACILNRPIAFQKIEKCSTISKKKYNKPKVEYRPTTHRTITTEEYLEIQQETVQSTIPTQLPTENAAVESYPPRTTVASETINLRPGDVLRLYDDSQNDIHDADDAIYKQKGYCSSQEYEIMKDNLLLYSHTRLMVQENNHSKDFLVSIMFSHYDQNNNGHLEEEELNKISLIEHLEDLSNGCALSDMLVFDDSNNDRTLNINEFYQAFNKLYSKPFHIYLQETES